MDKVNLPNNSNKDITSAYFNGQEIVSSLMSSNISNTWLNFSSFMNSPLHISAMQYFNPSINTFSSPSPTNSNMLVDDVAKVCSNPISKTTMTFPIIDTIGESAKNRFGRPYISGRPLLNCDRKKIIELFGNGYKKIAIAREIGVTHSCVSKVIKKYAETGIYEGKETRTASCACPGGSSNHDSRICRNTKFIKTENSLTTISLANKYKSSHLVSNFKRPNKSKKAVGFSVDFILSDKCGQR